jgi:DNA-directed RNA polymerase subunit RPC12/RpoP
VSGSNYILDHQCPQCGAAISLSETDRIFSCPYCRVRLFIFFQEFPSRYFPGAPGLKQNYFFVPYWRCKGTRYALTSGGVEPSLVDHSMCAVQNPPSLFPLSLGIRSQTLHMKFVEPLSTGIFLAPQSDFASARANVARSLARQKEFVEAVTSLHHTQTPMAENQAPAAWQPVEALIGELVSLVYSPFYVSQNFLFDGITGEKLNSWPENSVQMLDCRPPEPSFISTLCPECGSGLGAENDSFALVCGNCGRAWSAAGGGLTPLDLLLCSTAVAADLWLPFWRLDVSAKPLALCSIADFIRLTKAPRPVFPALEQQKFYLWVPAFKANPNLFLLLAKLMTLNQKETAFSETLPKDSAFYPVTLPASEGFEATRVVLGDISPARQKTLPVIKDLALSLVSSSLVYMPFVQKGQEYIQPDLNFGVMANALKWGRTM